MEHPDFQWYRHAFSEAGIPITNTDLAKVLSIIAHRTGTPGEGNDEAILEDRLIHWIGVDRLSKDLKAAAQALTREDVRILVKLFYDQQRQRVRINNQIKAAMKDGRPFQALEWAFANQKKFETNCQTMLSGWAEQYPVVKDWAIKQYGVGPIICAGLLAHLNETPPPNAGHWWSFAGMLPDSKMLTQAKAQAAIEAVIGRKSGQMTEPELLLVCAALKRKHETVFRFATTTTEGKTRALTVASASTALARRSWNAQLKTLLWKFATVQVRLFAKNPDKSFYGRKYYERKAYEQAQNTAGVYAAFAAQQLQEKRYGTETDAYHAYSNGELPPAHLHARALRWVAKLFLGHWHWVAWESTVHTPVAAPWVVVHGGHTEIVPPPGWTPLAKTYHGIPVTPIPLPE